MLALRVQLRKRKDPPNLYLNVELPDSNGSADRDLEDLLAVLGRHASAVDLRRFDADGRTLSGTFHLQCRTAGQLLGVQSELRKRFPQSVVTFVEQSDTPSG